MENDKITKIGANASEKAYIGKEKAKSIALEHASVEEKDTMGVDIDFDIEEGILVYEVDFETNKYEFEYDINASTGEIVNTEKEINEEYIEVNKKEEKTENPTNGAIKENINTTYIGKEKAKDIALNKAGINDRNIKDYEIELDKKEDLNDKDEYEISFKKDNVEYEIDIDAKTGEILDFKKEKDN